MAVVGYIRKGPIKLKKQRESIEMGLPVGRWFQEKSASEASSVFEKLLKYIWPEDTVALFDLHDLGRNADEVVRHLRKLSKKKVSIYCHAQNVKLPADALKTVLSVVAVLQTTPDSRLEKRSLQQPQSDRPAGRRRKVAYADLFWWRQKHQASILATAAHFGVSVATVKRACKESVQAQNAGH